MTEATATQRYRLTLPWPDKRLSPNARVHWSVLAQAKKTAKETTALWCRVANIRLGVVSAPVVHTTFHPPDKRRRDLDNHIACQKAANDAIAEALGVDDSRWTMTFAFGFPAKGGAVVVEISEAAP